MLILWVKKKTLIYDYPDFYRGIYDRKDEFILIDLFTNFVENLYHGKNSSGSNGILCFPRALS
jgi:hypothetical protein